jgi:hypothetical protein
MQPRGLILAQPGAMINGSKFRARGDEHLRAADSVTDPERKLAHLDLAHRWLRLASQIDELDGETTGDAPLVPSQAGASTNRS